MTRNTEAAVVELLISRAGKPTVVVATDGERMRVRDVVQTSAPSKLPQGCRQYAGAGGIPLSADGGRFFFFSNEIAAIEDKESGAVVFTREAI